MWFYFQYVVTHISYTLYVYIYTVCTHIYMHSPSHTCTCMTLYNVLIHTHTHTHTLTHTHKVGVSSDLRQGSGVSRMEGDAILHPMPHSSVQL